MNQIKSLARLYKTSRPYMLIGMIIEGAITYGFASLSIDRGNLWWYLLAIIFLIRTLKDLVRLIGSFTPYGRKTA